MGHKNFPKKLKVSLKFQELGLWEGVCFRAGKVYFRNLMNRESHFNPISVDIFLFVRGRWNKFSFSLNNSNSLCVNEASLNLKSLADGHNNFRSELLCTLGC